MQWLEGHMRQPAQTAILVPLLLSLGLVAGCGSANQPAAGGLADSTGAGADVSQPAPGERTLARGTSSVAGPWEIRASTSERIVYEDEEVQPAGLDCIMLVLLDPPAGTPRPGAGACGEFGENGLGALELPVMDRSGRAQVLLFGRAPARAAAVEVTASNAEPMRAHTIAGPVDVDARTWVLTVPPGLQQPRIDWVTAEGARAGTRLDASHLMDRGRRLAATAEPNP